MAALPGTPVCDRSLDPAAERHVYHHAGQLMRRLHQATLSCLLPDFETTHYEAASREFLRITMRALHARSDLHDAFFAGYGRQPTSAEQLLMGVCGAVDGTARVQTVDTATHPAFAALIRHFHHLTGVPVVLNTSFHDRERSWRPPPTRWPPSKPVT